MAWEITGNAGTSPNANFIGTTDSQALVVKTNNAECMRVTAEGRVGIGTDSPEADLHVKRDIEMGAGGPKAYLHLGAHDETRSFFGFGTDYLYLNGSQGTFGAFDSSGRLGLGTWTPEKTLHVIGAAQVNGPLDVLFGDFRASDNACLATRLGSVGIGTDSPQAKLHVVGDARVTGGLVVDGSFMCANFALPQGGDLSVNSLHVKRDIMMGDGGTQAYLHLGLDAATSSFIGFGTNHLYLHGPHGTFGVFSSSGRLGLGVDSPEADLHIKRDIMMGGGIRCLSPSRCGRPNLVLHRLRYRPSVSAGPAGGPRSF
jgi:hypothetical protein